MDNEPDAPEPKDADKRKDPGPEKIGITWFCYEVTIYGIVARVRPSGLCAMLIPHADSEKGMTIQQSLEGFRGTSSPFFPLFRWSSGTWI